MKEIDEILIKQKEFYNSGKTKNVKYRIEALKKLKIEIIKQEENIKEALKKDLNKSYSESYMTEIGMTLSELNYVLKHTKKWSRNKFVNTPIVHFPAISFKSPEPYGTVLILAPWNYPFMLLIEPLIGAISAGNTVILKPSEFSPNTSNIIQKIIENCFGKEYVAVIQGDKEVSQKLIEQKVDYIFYTGGTRVGKIVMESASKNLTPVTLELGGKSPCIVDETCNINLAAKRIVFGKLLNAGQTCIAPDYVLIDKKVKTQFIEYIKKYISEFLGEDIINNEEYPQIINNTHFNRLKTLLNGQNIIMGGKCNEKLLKIEPTLIDNPEKKSDVMNQEIFGPILPIIDYNNIEEAIEYIKSYEKPLALYLFTTNKQVQRKILNNISFGGGCINDTIIHIANSNMSFGGVGYSGTGGYHGKASFDTFSHTRSITKRFTLDLPLRYMPYSNIKDKTIKMFMK